MYRNIEGPVCNAFAGLACSFIRMASLPGYRNLPASGHIDSAGLLFLLLCLMAVVSGTKSSEPLLQSKGPLLLSIQEEIFCLCQQGWYLHVRYSLKLFPIIFLPAFIIFIPKQRSLIFLAGFLSAYSALSLPFLPDFYNMLDTLSVYLQNWEFSRFCIPCAERADFVRKQCETASHFCIPFHSFFFFILIVLPEKA